MAASKTVPTYYTLTRKGQAWLADEVVPPAKHVRALAALAELIEENDVPRTPEQVATISGTPREQAPEALAYLAHTGYVAKVAAPPRPAEKGQLAKIRIRSIEELAAAEARAEEARRRYAQSEKGKAAHYKYEDSDKGKSKNVKYWKDPDKGRKVQRRYRLSRRLKELTAFVSAHPEEKDRIQPDIDKVLQQLKELNGGKE